MTDGHHVASALIETAQASVEPYLELVADMAMHQLAELGQLRAAAPNFLTNPEGAEHAK